MKSLFTVRDGKLFPDGNNVQYKGAKGPLKQWMKIKEQYG